MLIPYGLKLYLIFWISCIIISIYLVFKHNASYEFLSSAYWKFLSERWKLITFFISIIGITLAGPYSGDSTWDIIDSVIISILVFITAPWSVGMFYRSLRRKEINHKLFVALSCFFLPCWTYDLYILVRDGQYPLSWAPNLVLSGSICFMAGLFWNLAWQKNKGLFFAFDLDTWPVVEATAFRHIIMPAVCFIILMASIVGWFVLSYLFN